MIAKLSNKRKIDKKTIISIGFILILILMTFILLINSDKFETLDMSITHKLQRGYLSESIKEKSKPIFLKIVFFLNSVTSPYIIIAIIFNFYTVYDCFMLVNILSLDYMICYILNIIYFKPPYQLVGDIDINENNEINIFFCGYGWGFPSEECIIMTSFYLSIWKILNKYSIKYTQRQKIIKYFFLIIILIVLFIFALGVLLIGYYYLSQILASFLIGLIIYLIIFETNFFNLLDGKKFLLSINKKYLYFIIVYFIAFIVLSISYIIQRLLFNAEYIMCKPIDDHPLVLPKSGKYSYIDGNYIMLFLFLGNIFSVIGIVIDIKYTYGGDEYSYLQFNFTQESENLLDNNSSQGSFNEIHITKETMWNHTDLVTSIFRLIIVLILTTICLLLHFLISLSLDVRIVLFLRILLPITLFSLGIFFYFKLILRLMRLTNHTLDSIISDS